MQEQMKAILDKPNQTDRQVVEQILTLLDLDHEDEGPEIALYDDYIRFDDEGKANLS